MSTHNIHKPFDGITLLYSCSVGSAAAQAVGQSTHQPTNDFYCTLIACITASTNQHGEKQGYHDVFLQRRTPTAAQKHLRTENGNIIGGSLDAARQMSPDPPATDV